MIIIIASAVAVQKAGLLLPALSRVIEPDTWDQTRCSVWLGLISHGNHKAGGLLTVTTGGMENVRKRDRWRYKCQRQHFQSLHLRIFQDIFYVSAALRPTAPRGHSLVLNGCWWIPVWVLETGSLRHIHIHKATWLHIQYSAHIIGSATSSPATLVDGSNKEKNHPSQSYNHWDVLRSSWHGCNVGFQHDQPCWNLTNKIWVSFAMTNILYHMAICHGVCQQQLRSLGSCWCVTSNMVLCLKKHKTLSLSYTSCPWIHKIVLRVLLCVWGGRQGSMYHHQVDGDEDINYILLHSEASAALKNVQTCTNQGCIIFQVGFRCRHVRLEVACKKCLMQNYILLCQCLITFIYSPH